VAKKPKPEGQWAASIKRLLQFFDQFLVQFFVRPSFFLWANNGQDRFQRRTRDPVQQLCGKAEQDSSTLLQFFPLLALCLPVYGRAC